MKTLVTHFILGLILLTSCGLRAVLALSNITFSQVEQCGSFNISLTGGVTSQVLPLTLTVVPFDSFPISIDIPNSAWRNGSNLSTTIDFVPLATDTKFVASLDDSSAQGVSLVSSVIKVKSSKDSSCLSQKTGSTTTYFNLTDTFFQCGSFNVTYDTQCPSPSVRVFIPMGESLYLPETFSAAGAATYTMTAAQGEDVVLLLSSGNSTAMTTNLTTVGGDSSSSSSCLPMQEMEASATTTATSTATQQSATDTSSTLSSGAVIAIAVASGVIVAGVAILMAIYIYRYRRRQWARQINRSGSIKQRDEEEKIDDRPPALPPKPFFVTSAHLYAPQNPTILKTPATSGSSVSQEAPDNPREHGNLLQPQADDFSIFAPSEAGLSRGPTLRSAFSLHSLDIERILEIAAMQSNYENSIDAISMRSTSTYSQLIPRQDFTPRHERDPSDVPVPADSCSLQLSPTSTGHLPPSKIPQSRFSTSSFSTEASKSGPLSSRSVVIKKVPRSGPAIVESRQPSLVAGVTIPSPRSSPSRTSIFGPRSQVKGPRDTYRKARN